MNIGRIHVANNFEIGCIADSHAPTRHDWQSRWRVQLSSMMCHGIRVLVPMCLGQDIVLEGRQPFVFVQQNGLKSLGVHARGCVRFRPLAMHQRVHARRGRPVVGDHVGLINHGDELGWI